MPDLHGMFVHDTVPIHLMAYTKVSVADPGGALEARAPPATDKTSQKKMAAAAGRKFHKSSGPPQTNFWIHYWV